MSWVVFASFSYVFFSKLTRDGIKTVSKLVFKNILLVGYNIVAYNLEKERERKGN